MSPVAGVAMALALVWAAAVSLYTLEQARAAWRRRDLDRSADEAIETVADPDVDKTLGWTGLDELQLRRHLRGTR